MAAVWPAVLLGRAHDEARDAAVNVHERKTGDFAVGFAHAPLESVLRQEGNRALIVLRGV